MSYDNEREPGFETLAIRAGQHRTQEREHSDPIFATSSFVFRNAEEAAARFSGELPGNIYSRFTNPTVRAFQERLSALEGGESCVATASGMAAILAMSMAVLRSGDHIVAAQGLFGTTTSLFANHLTRFGIEVSFVPATQPEAWRSALRARTRFLFVESPTNPMLQVADIAQLAAIAHANGSLLVVDNCLCTPALQQPLALGADLVVHSATKFLDGQGRCVGGAVVGDAATVGRDVFGFLRTAGPALSPFNAWVFLKGLETLGLRMRAHSEQALQLAQWLEAHPAVARVHYPGLPGHPQHALAARQQRGFGGLLSFEVAGGRTDAWHVIDSCRLLSITANLGDVRTSITHPASTTHARVAEDARRAAGITEGLLRLSVGLESCADLQDDLARGLDRIGR